MPNDGFLGHLLPRRRGRARRHIGLTDVLDWRGEICHLNRNKKEQSIQYVLMDDMRDFGLGTASGISWLTTWGHFT